MANWGMVRKSSAILTLNADMPLRTQWWRIQEQANRRQKADLRRSKLKNTTPNSSGNVENREGHGILPEYPLEDINLQFDDYVDMEYQDLGAACKVEEGCVGSSNAFAVELVCVLYNWSVSVSL
jgi:hypothetical protein